jgi:D-alanyl-D-alanine carboxypeptidase (penicillin-binding protein 5/6)
MKRNGCTRILCTAVSAALLLIIFNLFTPLSALAADTGEVTVNNCTALVIYDKTHDRYALEKDGFAIVKTSASAKVLMGLIACEQLESRLDEKITVSDKMLSETSGNSMRLRSGDVLSVRDLLYGAICGSYNDAAYVITHVVAGDSASFVSMMNTRALELGAKNTNYTNPIGYPDHDAMVTTAYDTLKIAIAASNNPLYMEISSAVKHTTTATSATASRQFYNRNYLIASKDDASYHNSKCSGMNAGISSDEAGWSIVTLAHDDGADYVCVLLGGREGSDGRFLAYDEINTHVNRLCREYNNFTVFKKGTTIGTTKVGYTGIATNDAPYVAKEDINVYLPTEGESNISYTVEFYGEVRAPLEAGDVIGKVIITSHGEKIGEGEIAIKESYEANGVMKFVGGLGSYVKSRAFIATLIFFAVAMAVTLFIYFNKPGAFSKKKYRRY